MIAWSLDPEPGDCATYHPKYKKPLTANAINGFRNLVAGTGFEPVTFGL
jgi:hypothetical protein